MVENEEYGGKLTENRRWRNEDGRIFNARDRIIHDSRIQRTDRSVFMRRSSEMSICRPSTTKMTLTGVTREIVLVAVIDRLAYSSTRDVDRTKRDLASERRR